MLLFYCSSGCTKAPQYYVIRTLSFLFQFGENKLLNASIIYCFLLQSFWGGLKRVDLYCAPRLEDWDCRVQLSRIDFDSLSCCKVISSLHSLLPDVFTVTEEHKDSIQSQLIRCCDILFGETWFDSVRLDSMWLLCLQYYEGGGYAPRIPNSDTRKNGQSALATVD